MKQNTLNARATDPKIREDSRCVFQPNAKKKRSFTGHIVGRYQRAGPNSWDDYHFVSLDGGPASVFPSVRVQVEPTSTHTVREQGPSPGYRLDTETKRAGRLGRNPGSARSLFEKLYCNL